MIEFLSTLSLLVGSTLRVSTPLLFAALGGLLSEKAGVVNIALEGMMLVGALGAAMVAHSCSSAWMGALGGMAAGVLLAAVYALFVIEFRADQIVAGMAMNMIAAGFTPFLSKLIYLSSTSTPSVPLEVRFQSAPIWIAWVFVVLIWFGMRFTPAGLWVQFAGEHPAALDAAGVRVKRVRWAAVLASGCLAGLGGATLSIFLASSFSRNMTAGRGFMALAALIFGKWRPVQTALACLLFGFSEAAQMILQGGVLWSADAIPVQFVQILPYVVTLGVLAGFVGHSRAPRALGQPFFKS